MGGWCPCPFQDGALAVLCLLAWAGAVALPVLHFLQQVCAYKQEFREGCVRRGLVDVLQLLHCVTVCRNWNSYKY